MKEQKVHKKKNREMTNVIPWDSPLDFYTLFRKKKKEKEVLITQVKALVARIFGPRSSFIPQE